MSERKSETTQPRHELSPIHIKTFVWLFPTFNAGENQRQTQTSPITNNTNNANKFEHLKLYSVSNKCQNNLSHIEVNINFGFHFKFIESVVCVCGPVGALMRTRCHSKPPLCSKYATACHKRIREQTANSLVYRLICTYLEYLLNDAFLINYKTISLHLN